MGSPTAGPWTLTHVNGSNFAVQEFEIRGMLGDKPNVYPIFQKDRSAINGATVYVSPENARLIAAAPEMYAALKRFVDADSCNALLIAEFTTTAMEALAKAEGKEPSHA